MTSILTLAWELSPRCVACGQHGADHRLPKRLAEVQAELWPGDFICDMCYDKYEDILTMIEQGININLTTDPWTTKAERKIYAFMIKYRDTLSS